MIAFFGAALRIAVPYVLAALGGTFSERAGVVNLALEGMLLAGAFATTVCAGLSGSGAVGVLAGAGAGLALAALYALLVVRLRGDQIVCGVALNLLADGATRFFLKALYGSSSNSPRIDALHAGGAGPFIAGAGLLVLAAHLVLYKTPFGLRVRAVGEHPEAAASLGVEPARVRLLAVLLSGALAGLGGAWLAVDQRQFVAGMSSGRGYIALAALIFGGWRPAVAAAAALAFAALEATQITLQASGIGIPGWAVQLLPYLATLVALSGVIGHPRAPRALGKRGEP